MLHVVLLLYLLSFTTGIIVMTILGFIFLMRNRCLIRYTISANFFFTLTLIFDAIRYYMSILDINFPYYVYGVLIVAALTSIIIRTYYVLHIVYEIIQKPIAKREEQIFMGISVAALSLMAILFLMYLLHKIESNIVERYGSNISISFTVGGNIFFAIFLIRSFRNISENLKAYIKISIAIIGTIDLTAFIYNVFIAKIAFKYHVAFSPLIYFCFNVCGIYFLSQYLHKSYSANVSYQKVKYEVLAEQYNITKREYEIIELVIEGCSNQRISEALCLSPHTVRNHIYSIYKKMQITSKIQLINIVSMQNNTLEANAS